MLGQTTIKFVVLVLLCRVFSVEVAGDNITALLPPTELNAFKTLYQYFRLGQSKEFRKLCPGGRGDFSTLCSWCDETIQCWDPTAETGSQGYRGKTTTQRRMVSNLDGGGFAALILSGLALRGTIPTIIGQLKNLVDLDFSNNLLSGSIPTEMGQLTSMVQLLMHRNQLKGQIPCNIGSLKKLSILLLNNNLLEGSVPTEFGKLRQLSLVTVYSNALSGPLAPLLSSPALEIFFGGRNNFSGTLPSLKHLKSLSNFLTQNNRIYGSIPAELLQIKTLVFLDLSSNLLTGTIPDNVESPLDFFRVSKNALTGSIPSGIASLKSLQYLDVGSNSLVGTVPILDRLESLRFLDLSHNGLSSFPTLFGALVDLESVVLSHNSFVGALPSDLGGLSKLHLFDASDNSFSSAIPENLQGLGRIQTFNISHNIIAGSVPVSFSKLRTLHYVDLSHNSISGTIPDLSAFQMLKRLQVNNNQFAGAFPIFGSSQWNLTHIDVSANLLSGPFPGDQISSLPSIRTLIASSNCFSGSLSESICSATTLEYLVLNGIGSGCQVKSWGSNSLGLRVSTASSTFRGSVAPCFFVMPLLRSLHLSGNRLSGVLHISENYASLDPPLEELSLAYNKLTGVLPNVLLARANLFRIFDVSHNRLVGTLGSLDGVKLNGTLKMTVNRFSGQVPSLLFPPSPEFQFRGSEILQGNFFECSSSRSDLPQWDPYVNLFSCGSDQFDKYVAIFFGVVFGTFSFYLLRQFWLRRMWAAISASFFKRPSSILVSLAPVLATIYELRTFSYIVLLIVAFPGLPLFACLSALYSSHFDTYSWSISAAFKSGRVPAVLLYFCWLFQILLVDALLQIIVQLRATSDSTPTIATNKGKFKTMPLSSWFLKSALFFLNSLLSLVLNCSFIVTLEKLSSSGQMAAKAVLALLKLAQNFGLVKGFDALNVDRFHNKYGFVTFALFFNNIASPVIASAFVMPTCFRDAVFEPAPVVATYQANACSTIGKAATELADEGHLYMTGVVFNTTCVSTDNSVPYSPRFTYGFQCMSSLLVAYAPVMIMTALITMAEPFVTLLIRKTLDLCCPMEILKHYGLAWFLPRIHWTLGERLNNPYKTKKTDYFNSHGFYSSLTLDLLIAMSFGLACPVVGVCFIMSLILRLSVAYAILTDATQRQDAHDIIQAIRSEHTEFPLEEVRQLLLILPGIFLGLILGDIAGDDSQRAGAALFVFMALSPLALSRLVPSSIRDAAFSALRGPLQLIAAVPWKTYKRESSLLELSKRAVAQANPMFSFRLSPGVQSLQVDLGAGAGEGSGSGVEAGAKTMHYDGDPVNSRHENR